jgi:hypothetical protein
MSITLSANSAHQATSNASEMTRQADVAKAIAAGGSSATVQAAITAADAAHFRRVIASGIANNIQVGVFQEGLREITGSYT